MEYTEHGWRSKLDTKRHHRERKWNYRGRGVYHFTLTTCERYPLFGELSGDITMFDYAAGSLREKQVIKADRMDARGAADIHLSPDGRFLLCACRDSHHQHCLNIYRKTLFYS